ncbi:Protein AGENET DOMAIN (AGD)-CONTAINING P1 [Linum perenne]
MVGRVITKELNDRKFMMFFRGSKQQIVFWEKDLQMQREWIQRKWNPPFVETVTGAVKFRVGMEVEMNTEEEGFEGAWFATTIVEVKASGEDNNKMYRLVCSVLDLEE